MKTSRVTRRVVRQWGSRLRAMPIDFLVSTLRLSMSERERDVLGALVMREIHRRMRSEVAS